MSAIARGTAGHRAGRNSGKRGDAFAALLLRTLAVCALGLSPSAGANESLTYDANGNVLTRALPGGTTSFGYDDLNRVNSEAGPAKTQSITYDANGNRRSDGSGSKTYTENTDRIATENGQSIGLDAVGNLTQARGLTFAWNQAGQLQSVSQGATLLASYYYDYKGRRSRKVKAGAGSLSYRTTIYVYDLYDRLVAELDGTGHPRLTYGWRDDVPVSIIYPGGVLYLETDHLGTPIAARNQAGTVVWKWESDAFGSTPANEDPDGDGIPTTINLRFPGQYYDQESGLHYNYYRDYDPSIGRYVQSDPIGLDGGINTYAYGENNPLSLIDPLGLWAWGDPIPQNAIDFFGGAGDVLLLGFGSNLRGALGIDGGVNVCSKAYGYGEWAGFTASLATGLAGGLKAAGSKGLGKEFSHWLPNRMGGSRSIWNGNYVTPASHYYHDPFRYPPGWRDLGPKWPAWQQQIDRIPNVYKGAGAGAAYGAAGMAGANCGCESK